MRKHAGRRELAVKQPGRLESCAPSTLGVDGPRGPRPTPLSDHVLSAQTEPDQEVQRG
jgi:hypothetical protein